MIWPDSGADDWLHRRHYKANKEYGVCVCVGDAHDSLYDSLYDSPYLGLMWAMLSMMSTIRPVVVEVCVCVI